MEKLKTICQILSIAALPISLLALMLGYLAYKNNDIADCEVNDYAGF